ncbi:MAG TPA: hypothetical protein VHB18_11580 [Mycobacteriales bacterium]|jgi:hypothetical protein|nr:hypothetical protein [Mycobacteriales bacterium]
MNVEDLVRDGLRDAAEQAAPIADLHLTAIRRGRQRRAVRRATATGGVVLTVAAIAGVGILVTNNTGGAGHHVLQPASGGGNGQQQVVADPWWQTWTVGRHDGAVDPHFLAAAAPTYDTASGPEKIKVWAAGTTGDGTQWALYSDESSPHVMQWLQGWDGSPDFGESDQKVVPDLSWTSWTIPTRDSHDGVPNITEWLIVVGRPGTTSIDYSTDGTTWQPMNVQDGIAVMKLTTATGFPPAAAKVRMADAKGVYATGVPAGAGVDPYADPTTGETKGSVVPSATPTSASVKPPANVQRINPSSASR